VKCIVGGPRTAATRVAASEMLGAGFGNVPLLKLHILYLICPTDIIDGPGQKQVYTFLDLKTTWRTQVPLHPQKALITTNDHT